MNDMIETKMQTPIEWSGQVVITTSQLAEVYGTEPNNIKNNFNNHKENFIKGKHFFYLQGEDLKEFKNLVNDIDLVAKGTSQLYLWTERGANRHCKILDTDKAWEQFDNLEETYFKIKQKNIDMTQLSPQLQLMNLLVENMNKQELEQKRQAEALQRLEDKTNKQTEALQTVKDTFSKSETEEETVQWVNHCINKIAESPNFVYSFGNRYAAAKNESYNRLSTKAGCRLDQKLRNSIARAEERGYTKAQINTINKLSVIMADKRLKQIYIGVIKEMMIAYCVEIA